MRTIRAIALLAACAAVAPEAAAQITVNTAEPGIAADGLCSIVEAVDNANIQGTVHADCAPGDLIMTTITLPPGLAITFSQPQSPTDDGNALPVITARMVLQGGGSTLRRSAAAGTPPFRLAFVAAGAELEVHDLGFENGLANADGTGLGGGAIYSAGSTTVEACRFVGNTSRSNGGALSNIGGTMVVRSSVIDGNRASQSGGGLWNLRGTVSVAGSSFSANQSQTAGEMGRGGAVANVAFGGPALFSATDTRFLGNATMGGRGGGGLDNAAGPGQTATVRIVGGGFVGNSAVGPDHTLGLGGAIQNSVFRGTSGATVEVSLDGVAFTGNTGVNGGAISNGIDFNANNTLRLTIANSSLVGNTADGEGFQVGNGGALYLINATASVSNTTISGNAALGTGDLSGLGGGIMHGGLSTGTGRLDLRHVTIEDNAALAGGGLAVFNFSGSAQATVANTIVAARSMGSTCFNAGAITSNGGNVDESGSCNFTAASDQRNVPAILSPRDAAGGLFHRPLPGSPAIDAGNPAFCTAADQIGTPRPLGAACDSGAIEQQWAPVSLHLDTIAFLNDGTRPQNRFYLLQDGTFVDVFGANGTWSRPSGLFLIEYTEADIPGSGVGPACGGTYLGRVTTAPRVAGVAFCRDGSPTSGPWFGITSTPTSH
ncbi:MAG TPA: choice-of-anchor Q domain-containing protein [Vicinamibacterales bacterium]